MTWLIGSDPMSDLVVDRPSVSWRHCRLTLRADGSYALEDLGSTNGTFVNGRRVHGEVRVGRGDAVTLGLSVPMPWPPEPFRAAPQEGGRDFLIGRDPDNDLVVDNPEVSGRHARVRVAPGGREAVVEDLGSTNGTAVGAVENRVTRAAIGPHDVIYLGPIPVPAAQFFPGTESRLNEPVPELVVHGPVMTVGRDPGCERVVDFPMVSGRHARFVRSGAMLVVEDLGSSNGTFVNGERASPTRVVRAGDLIGLGSYTMRLVDGSADLGPATPATLPVPFDPAPPAAPPWPAAGPPARGSAAVSRPLAVAAGVGVGAQAGLLAGLIVATAGGAADALFGLAVASAWIGLSAALFERVLAPAAPADGSTPAALASGLARSFARPALFALTLCGVVLGIVSARLPFEAAWPSVWGVLGLTALVGVALGLVVVRVVGSLPLAFSAAVVLVSLMAAVGGPSRPLPGLSPPVRLVAGALPTRWSFETLLLLNGRGADDDPDADPAERFFPGETLRTGTRAGATALLAMLVGLLYADAVIVLGRSAGPKTRGRAGAPSA